MSKPTSAWEKRLLTGIGAVLAVAVGARAAWELLAPLVPGLVIFLIVIAVTLFVLQRH